MVMHRPPGGRYDRHTPDANRCRTVTPRTRLERAHQVHLPRGADALEHREVQPFEVQPPHREAARAHADPHVLRPVDVHLPVGPGDSDRLGGPHQSKISTLNRPPGRWELLRS